MEWCPLRQRLSYFIIQHYDKGLRKATSVFEDSEHTLTVARRALLRSEEFRAHARCLAVASGDVPPLSFTVAGGIAGLTGFLLGKCATAAPYSAQ